MMTSLGRQLKGEVELDYKPTGFAYRLDVPLDALITKPKSGASAATA